MYQIKENYPNNLLPLLHQYLPTLLYQKVILLGSKYTINERAFISSQPLRGFQISERLWKVPTLKIFLWTSVRTAFIFFKSKIFTSTRSLLSSPTIFLRCIQKKKFHIELAEEKITSSSMIFATFREPVASKVSHLLTFFYLPRRLCD